MGYPKLHFVLLLLFWSSSTFCLCELWEESAAELFRQWRAAHKKVYAHEEETERRFLNFKRNLRYAIEKNSRRRSPSEHTVGMNKFADMTNEEFRERFFAGVKRPGLEKKGRRRRRSMRGNYVGSCDAPATLDWRKYGVVTAVKDQGDCGSCWAFASTGAIEGINAINKGDLVSLSEQELVDCDSSNYGCEGGYMDYAYEWVISNGGIDTESDYAYSAVDGTCNATKEERKVVSINEYRDVEQSDSAILCAVAQQPVSAGMDGSAIDFQLYTGGIYSGKCSDDADDIDHAVLIVGYGSDGDEDYWIVKNSWGTSWGLEGYFYLKRNTNLGYGECAINYMVSYPIQDSSSSSPSPYPSPTPPPPPPSPPPPSPPPPSPGPSPSVCGDFSYCPFDETCCCLFEINDACLIYGCCPYQNAVCCAGTDYCCPSDYPICDVREGLCFESSGSFLGVAAKKRRMAKHKFPWTKYEETVKQRLPDLQWRRNRPFAAMR